MCQKWLGLHCCGCFNGSSPAWSTWHIHTTLEHIVTLDWDKVITWNYSHSSDLQHIGRRGQSSPRRKLYESYLQPKPTISRSSSQTSQHQQWPLRHLRLRRLVGNVPQALSTTPSASQVTVTIGLLPPTPQCHILQAIRGQPGLSPGGLQPYRNDISRGS